MSQGADESGFSIILPGGTSYKTSDGVFVWATKSEAEQVAKDAGLKKYEIQSGTWEWQPMKKVTFTESEHQLPLPKHPKNKS